MRVLPVLVLMLGFVIFVKAQTDDKSILTGTIYDGSGALIPKAKVTALGANGERFEAETNNEGVYVLKLPFNLYAPETDTADFRIAKYEIIVDLTSRGLEKFVLRDFKFVPSTNGKMNLDIALDSLNPEPCGYGGNGCAENPEIETPPSKVSDKILLKKPLEELPKEQNKFKRKKKDNKQ